MSVLLMLCGLGIFTTAYVAKAGVTPPVTITSPDGNRPAEVNASGQLLVTSGGAAVSTFETKRASIGANACSGTLLNPSATSSLFIMTATGTTDINVCPGCSATILTGLLIGAGGSLGADNVSITSFSACNVGIATATITMVYGR